MSAILLCPSKSVESFDEAGTSIIKSILPNSTPTPGPYEFIAHPALSYVPSLAYFCIRKLIEYPEVAQGLGGPCIRYETSLTRQNFDIIRALIPSAFDADQDRDHLCLCTVDPRLWALLIQIYTNLPRSFHRFILPLGDRHLPILQHIRSNPNFAMITILELPKCSSLTDDTILELKVLHSLCALDASGTPLTAHGMQRLGWSVSVGDAEPRGLIGNRGPWELRILRLQDCKNIDNSLFSSIVNFPLLCVIDIRGTKATGSGNRAFKPCPHRTLFHPVTITDALDNLVRISQNFNSLFSHPHPFVVHVNCLSYPSRRSRGTSQKPSTMPDTFTFLPIKQKPINPHGPSSSTPPRIITGNSEILTQARSLRGSDLQVRYALEELENAGHPAAYREALLQLLELLRQNRFLTSNGLNDHIDAVVEEEGRGYSSLQTLQRFYGEATTIVPGHQCQYTKPSPSHRFGSGSQPWEELFMLFREPPPWKNFLGPVNDSIPPQKPLLRDAGFVASVDRRSTKALRRTGGIFDMIAARQKAVGANKPRPILRVSERAQSRNPFSRESVPSGVVAEKPGTNPSSSGIANFPDARTIQKPLKPISSLVIPPPTEPAFKKHKTKRSSADVDVAGPKQKSKQTTLPGMFFKRTQ